jgi:hypothetical protein
MKLPVTMVDGGIYGFVIPTARTIAGFFVGMMLGIVGGWAALTFNAMVGYPWGANIHLAIYVFGIGLGAGIGAHGGWINLSLRWYAVLATIFLVIAAGVIGSAIGNAYWNFFTDASYMGDRDTRVNMTHFGGTIAAGLMSTVFGLYYHFRTRG